MIHFNKTCITGLEKKYVDQIVASGHLAGGGTFSQKCQQWFNKILGCDKSFMTPSCTAALEMAAILLDIKQGDEVILPSYTFVSTANAFALRGAWIKFIDVHPDTMNMDVNLIESAITKRTKAIVPVHYAGVSCDMDRLLEIAEKNSLYIIEDAAQAMMAKYKSEYVGVKGHLAAYSFHETKNYTSGGEGGLLIINDKQFSERAEIIREKGTNRSQFFRGEIDKYSWVDIGSSYLPGELQSAYLFAQLEVADEVLKKRLELWSKYYEGLSPLQDKGLIELPIVPDECQHNGHMFYLKCYDCVERSKLIGFLKKKRVSAILCK